MAKEEFPAPHFPNKYNVIGADLSLRRPGFCIIQMVDGKINWVHLVSIDNKGKKKTHGRILSEIYDTFYYDVLDNVNGNDMMYLVREKEIMHMKIPSERDVTKVVGIMDYISDDLHEQYNPNTHEGFWRDIYPVTVKKQITGSGKATKEEVAEALVKYVGKLNYRCDDESDATAVAVAWLIQQGQIKEKK